ncbi:MAG: J domain-containing protein [Aquamicrobium sp.]|uniref:J domain-containing protein n=1 Tax=Aquamicrobium sp. TaxID=1872579 RepID=UPI00349EA2CB|nr:J domain-containing protein [Aquamicrobium sp.]
MKLDSPLFDRIRVKPTRDRRPAGSPGCQWPGCASAATHRAPKGRDHEHEYWRFCLDHVREYNHSYNYFSGMSADAVERFQKDAIIGHRPTWKLGENLGARFRRLNTNRVFSEETDDPFTFGNELGGGKQANGASSRAESERRIVRNAARKALHKLGLEDTASRDEIKSRFKELVKRHHPDVNGGDRSFEDKLREVIEAYKFLKTSGLV